MYYALKSQLLQEIDPMFLDVIGTGPFKFTIQIMHDLLDYLYQAYGQVTILDLRENNLSMRKPYNSATPIKCLYKIMTIRFFCHTSTRTVYNQATSNDGEVGNSGN